jgi:hypothetical protein
MRTKLPVRCPICGQRIGYRGSVDGVHVYRCETDGPLLLRRDGTFNQARSDESRIVRRAEA